ncbi:hypothetical protein GCM10009101_22230 [Brevundimonas lenta]
MHALTNADETPRGCTLAFHQEAQGSGVLQRGSLTVFTAAAGGRHFALVFAGGRDGELHAPDDAWIISRNGHPVSGAIHTTDGPFRAFDYVYEDVADTVDALTTDGRIRVGYDLGEAQPRAFIISIDGDASVHQQWRACLASLAPAT